MSKSSSLIPLIITLLLAIIAAVVGFAVFAIVTSISDTTSQKMQKHNINVSREGLKVGVKEVNHESYTDRTQNVLVKVWNHASWPAYQSKLGWGQPKDQTASKSTASGLSASAQPSRAGTEHRNTQPNVRKA